MKRKMIRAVILVVLLAFLSFNASKVSATEETAVEVTLEKADNVSAGVILEMSQLLEEVESKHNGYGLRAGVTATMPMTIFTTSEATVVAPERETVQSMQDNNEIVDETVDTNSELEYEEVSETEQALSDESTETQENEDASEQYSDEMRYKIYILAKAIYGEAGICDTTEKYRVGTVVMNRLERPDFANTLEGVLAQGYECYKNDIWYNSEPTEEEYQIAEDILVNGTRVFDKTVVFQMQEWRYGEKEYVSKWHVYSSKPIPE